MRDYAKVMGTVCLGGRLTSDLFLLFSKLVTMQSDCTCKLKDYSLLTQYMCTKNQFNKGTELVTMRNTKTIRSGFPMTISMSCKCVVLAEKWRKVRVLTEISQGESFGSRKRKVEMPQR